MICARKLIHCCVVCLEYFYISLLSQLISLDYVKAQKVWEEFYYGMANISIKPLYGSSSMLEINESIFVTIHEYLQWANVPKKSTKILREIASST